ncbi:hypothetical protein Poly41_49210 [Novipirellula artificiosorum]|uniref:Uncharacterized protein n=1 Tax=Novipirellula artificiosorum TaxID=2528016 RepID=A0A5C6DDX9_9BACT|nr:hypothetical protein Poly41_49210 [Novipirellula artificiosorum]
MRAKVFFNMRRSNLPLPRNWWVAVCHRHADSIGGETSNVYHPPSTFLLHCHAEENRQPGYDHPPIPRKRPNC